MHGNINLIWTDLHVIYKKYSDYEIDSILNYSLYNTFQFNNLQEGPHDILQQFTNKFNNNDSIVNQGIWKRFCACDQTPFGDLLI